MLQELLESAGEFWIEALAIWASGGWAMWAIAAIAIVMFGMGLHIWVNLRSKGFRSVPERTWRRWIDHQNERVGPIGDLLDAATGAQTLKQMSHVFTGLRMTETVPFDRDLKVMKICVSAAPLVGLLGTVTGMLATFGALATGSGGDQTMGMVASGISEALITTETGLVIALPGLFFQYQLVRQAERYKAFLTHLETVCAQTIHRASGRSQEQLVRKAALAEVARMLQSKLGGLSPVTSAGWPLKAPKVATAGADATLPEIEE